MKPILALLLLLLTYPAVSAVHPVDDYYRAKWVLAEGVEPDVAHLLTAAEARCGEQPDNADAWLSAGIIRAARAKALGISGLTELKHAKRDLERSIQIDPSWLVGYARAFLARLHLTVPPWPLSFWSNRRGTALLAQVLDDEPSSLPGNLYEGLRLKDAERFDESVRHLRIAASVHLYCECPSWQRYLQRQAVSELSSLQPSPDATVITDEAPRPAH